MTPNSYSVTFYRKSEKSQKDYEYLGHVQVDDHGTGPHLTLAAKAFRHASEVC